LKKNHNYLSDGNDCRRKKAAITNNNNNNNNNNNFQTSYDVNTVGWWKILHAERQGLGRWLPTAAARVRARSGHLGFVVDIVVLGQVLCEYFGFPCQSSFHQILHPHIHPGLAQ
jgi:hypothetical protein